MTRWMGYSVEELTPASGQKVDEVVRFLAEQGLKYEPHPDVVLILRDESGTIAATGSLAGKVIKHFAVRSDLRGEALGSSMFAALYEEALASGISNVFVFTSPESASLFRMFGAKLLVSTEKACLLEYGMPNIDDYIGTIQKAPAEFRPAAAIVMNANPFTKGHQYLVEYAASRFPWVYLFVVSEDRSAFPFEIRWELIRKGTEHLRNVHLCPTSDYCVSASTFPSYFLRRPDEAARIQAELDAVLFAERIAAPLSIGARVVGEEPLCETTAIYNAAMLRAFSPRGIELVVVPRLCVDGEVVSASRVRKALVDGDWESIHRLVPQTTYDFLRSERSKCVMGRLGGVH